MTRDTVLDHPLDAHDGATAGAQAHSAGSPSGRRSRLRRFSVTGGVLAVAFAAMSATPSLVPRGWIVQGLLAGLALAVGYGIGAFMGWSYRALGLPDLPAAVRSGLWKVLAVVTPVVLIVTAWLGRIWQGDQRELLGMDRDVSWLWLLSPILGIAVAAVLLAIGRAIKAVGRAVFRPLGRRLPTRAAWLIAVVVTTALTWGLLSGVLVGNGLAAADKIFEGNNDKDKPGVVNPQSEARSGGPASGLSWDSLGREGRSFISSGPTAADIDSVVKEPDAVEPVRAFVGLKAAQTPTERADLAVAELRRLGGFERGAIAVAGGTGSGWIDPKAADSLEYVTHGDVATVSMQYSYLPSWLSFLVDQSRAATNAEQLITAIRVELDRMPADARPELYVYGESLGAFSTDSAFTSVEDMSTTTDGALLIGPPSFDETWQKVVEGREPGSPTWKPVYGGGNLVRVATTTEDLADQTLTWTTDNPIIYLTHASDPIVAWTADHRAWLDPRGPDVSTQVVAWPIVAGLQATIDQIGANGVPPGHGHVYDETIVDAWSEIVGPPTLPAGEVASIRAAIGGPTD